MLPPHPVRPPASTRPLAQPPKQLAISFIRPFRSSLKNTPPRCSILIAALQLASPARPRQLHDTPRYPQISIARQGVAPFSLPLPRFRSLAVFVRRPGVRGTVREGPASENHLKTGLMGSQQTLTRLSLPVGLGKGAAPKGRRDVRCIDRKRPTR